MRVSELEGGELDYWVAQAEGLKKPNINYYPDTDTGTDRYFCSVVDESATKHFGQEYRKGFRPSKEWAIAGEIIDRENISVVFVKPHYIWDWAAGTGSGGQEFGNTALEAAMRAYVNKKFGDYVEDDVTGSD